MRVLITGMGGELGTRVASELEATDAVELIVGVDGDPPRDRLHRAEFHRIDPRDRRRLVALVEEVAPTAVVHLGIYEPNARVSAPGAIERTEAVAVSVLGAAAESGALEHVVVRSGIEIYGRSRNAVTCPDETVLPRPTSPFGVALLHAETVARQAATVAGATLARLRFAPLVGPHFPSPLGRYLRLPVVPVSATGDLPFSLLHQEDATAAIVRALHLRFDGAVNVVSPGAVTGAQAARMGGRLPLPIAGPAWILAKLGAEVLGAPLPDHVRELFVRGRCADGSFAEEALGLTTNFTTPEVVKDLFEWASVTYLDPVIGEVVA